MDSMRFLSDSPPPLCGRSALDGCERSSVTPCVCGVGPPLVGGLPMGLTAGSGGGGGGGGEI